MRHSKLLLSIPLLLAIAACDDTGVNPGGAPPPEASVRFVNAVVDTGTVDLRFVDRVENLPMFMGREFRTHSGMYQRVGQGTRAARIFPYSTDINVTTVRLVDTNVNLAADTRYTLVYAGRAAAGASAAEAHRLAVIQDARIGQLPPENQIAVKALHTVVGAGSVDVYIVPVDAADAPTPADWATNNAGVLSNVSFLEQSAYLTVPARPRTAGALYRFVVTPAGSTQVLFAATPDQPGLAAPTGATYGPQPGVQIGRSVLTAVVAPGSTPGTRGSTTANQTPTVFLMVDEVLNP